VITCIERSPEVKEENSAEPPPTPRGETLRFDPSPISMGIMHNEAGGLREVLQTLLTQLNNNTVDINLDSIGEKRESHVRKLN